MLCEYNGDLDAETVKCIVAEPVRNASSKSCFQHSVRNAAAILFEFLP